MPQRLTSTQWFNKILIFIFAPTHIYSYSHYTTAQETFQLFQIAQRHKECAKFCRKFPLRIQNTTQVNVSAHLPVSNLITTDPRRSRYAVATSTQHTQFVAKEKPDIHCSSVFLSVEENVASLTTKLTFKGKKQPFPEITYDIFLGGKSPTQHQKRVPYSARRLNTKATKKINNEIPAQSKKKRMMRRGEKNANSFHK